MNPTQAAHAILAGPDRPLEISAAEWPEIAARSLRLAAPDALPGSPDQIRTARLIDARVSLPRASLSLEAACRAAGEARDGPVYPTEPLLCAPFSGPAGRRRLTNDATAASEVISNGVWRPRLAEEWRLAGVRRVVRLGRPSQLGARVRGGWLRQRGAILDTGSGKPVAIAPYEPAPPDAVAGPLIKYDVRAGEKDTEDTATARQRRRLAPTATWHGTPHTRSTTLTADNDVSRPWRAYLEWRNDNDAPAPAHPTPVGEPKCFAPRRHEDHERSHRLPEIVVNALSDAQLEAVDAALTAHRRDLRDTHGSRTGVRQGFLIGDGTGMGKGRMLASLAYAA